MEGIKDAREVGIYRKLLEHNPVASAELYTYIIEEIKLPKLLKNKYYSLDEDDIYEKVLDSIMALSEHPEKFDSKKRSLLGYIRMDAEGDVKNLLDKQKRVENKFGKVVELHPNDGNSVQESGNPESELLQQEAEQSITSLLNRLFPDATDYELARLILSSERDAESYISILNLEHLNTTAQQAEVKRNKDRIKKMIERSPLKKFIDSYRNG